MMRALGLAAALLATASTSISLLPTAVRAQDSDTPKAYEPPVRRAKPARNDAYSGPSNTPGLGTLPSNTSPSYAGASPYSSPYDRTSNDAPGSSYGAPPSDYRPSYGAPARPYGEATAPAPAASPSYGGGYAQAPGNNDAYRPNNGYTGDSYGREQPAPQRQPYMSGGGNADAPYAGSASTYGSDRPYQNPDRYSANTGGGYGQPYSPPPQAYDREDDRPPHRIPERTDRRDGTFSADEIGSAGHRFFGSVSQGLANIIEHAFKRQGRPNGYILGEEAGGALVAGLRYGEGTLYTRDAGTHKVFWQGPSIGWDAGAAGSKVMVLVYNLRDPNEIYERFGGVDGSAYVVGGLGLTFLKRDHITLAPIRSGVGLRLGANVGYLKYTPRPTWNPF